MRRTLDPDTRESTLKRSMRRTRTAPLITCREREGEDSGRAVPYFFPPVGSRRGGDGATHGRPVPTPWLVSSSFSSDATL